METNSHNSTILVVEDERLVGLDIIRTLEKFGYRTLGPVATGQEAKKIANDQHPDVILMDIMLEGDIDGISTGAAIRDSLGIPVIFVTAYADQGTLDRAKLVEPGGYLIKPFNDLELRAAIEMNLNRRGTNVRMDKYLSSFASDSEQKPNGTTNDQNDIQGAEEFLRATGLFAELDDAHMSLLAQGCSTRALKTGQSFMYDSSDISPAFVVQTGRVAIVKTSPEGKQLIVEVLGPGDPFGLVIALERVHAPLTVRAQRKTDLLLVPRSSLLLALKDHSSLAIQLAEYAAQRLRALQDTALAIAYHEVPVRIAATLANLVKRFGYRDPSGGALLLDISRRELADLTGSTVETVVRVLKHFEKLGIVKTGRRRLLEVSDLERLATFAEQKKINNEWSEVAVSEAS